jgi:2,3-bisphosphoglycerate-dependent phosphoglycerate mutase
MIRLVETVILARHGESELSAAGLVSGDPAEPRGLTEIGREQARRLGERLAGEPIDLCVTSEFVRVRETADLALAGREIPRVVIPELNDVRFGEFEGQPFEVYRAWARERDPTAAAPGGESRAEVAARYVRGFRRVLERPERTILVVAHGLPLRYTLLALEGLDPTPIVEQVPLAEPYRLTRAELERATARLERWSRSPVWAVPSGLDPGPLG